MVFVQLVLCSEDSDQMTILYYLVTVHVEVVT